MDLPNAIFLGCCLITGGILFAGNRIGEAIDNISVDADIRKD